MLREDPAHDRSESRSGTLASQLFELGRICRSGGKQPFAASAAVYVSDRQRCHSKLLE